MGIFDNPAAFRPFCDEGAAISGRRENRDFETSVLLSCLDGTFDGGYSPESTDSELTTVVLYVPLSGRLSWPYTFAPQRGDIVRLERGGRFAVTKVDVDCDFYILEAREK